MMKQIQILTVLLVLGAVLFSACAPPPPPATDQTGLPNPAAVHCQEQGYQYETRSDEAGNQYGVCIFPDGSECDAWAYFRDECQPGDEKPIGMANPASVFCHEQGFQLEVRTDANGNQVGVCVFPDGTECEEWAYFRDECAPGGDMTETPSSDIQREPAPPVAATHLDALAAGNSDFAFDLFQTIRPDDQNLFFSPYSISLALAMTYAGARNETEMQMADTLHFTLPQNDLHPTFNALDQDLAGRSELVGPEEAEGFQLNIANALWGQEGYSFLPEFLDLLAANYGAGMNLLDIAADPEAARITINDWVSDQTEERIQDLLPLGSLDALTRLVLTNAIYFNAAWLHPFEENATQDGTFTLLDGSEIMKPMMQNKDRYGYGQGAGYQAVQLPYIGNQLSMVVLMPDEGEFDAFSSKLDAEHLTDLMQGIRYQEVNLTFPKFTFDSETQLRQALVQIGMPLAFDGAAADFSGMDGTQGLFIDDVYHKAFVAVDEAGTEAAAATAVVMKLTAAMPEDARNVTIDQPFLFLIQDNPTGTILYVGQVVEPVQ